jgi:Uma2 family endonuclease
MRAVPRVPPFDRRATYGDLEKVSDIMIAEIADGELHASPRPALPHAVAGSALQTLISGSYQFGRGGPGGWWIIFEPELHLGPDVLVPDIAGWRQTRLPHVPAAPWLSVPPDWICELLSPSTEAFDRARKLAMYAREGVAHAWLVDPIARTLEVLRLESGRWIAIATCAGSQVVRLEPFADVDIELGTLWWRGDPADVS